MIFHIDTTATEKHIERLELMNKSALPIVVRLVLNAVAIRTKTETMPKTSDSFIHRKHTFFIANSRAELANGLEISNMQSMVGFKPKADDKSHSVEDLQEQEDGGVIHNRAFVALPGARTGQQWQGLTANKYRRANKPKVFDSKDYTGKSPEQAFAKAAYAASLAGGILIGNRVNSRGDKIAWTLKPVGLQGQRGGARMVMSFHKKYVQSQVYAVKKGREVKPLATHFMERASIEAARQMQKDFIKFANAKLNKIK